MPGYDEAFFAGHAPGSRASAQAVLPGLLEQLRPASVVDLGCGTGSWLAVAREEGVEDVLGLDGPWVPREQLEIPQDRFREADLAAPPDLGRAFGLAISVEVAEHLPEEAAAPFVRALAGLAPVVLFSAAVPGQGGTGHVHEAWPDVWWGHFAAAGHVALDPFRDRLWEAADVDWWYAQNLLLYVARDHLAQLPQALRATATDGPPRAMVHPASVEVLRRERDWYAHHHARLEGEVARLEGELERLGRDAGRGDGPAPLEPGPDRGATARLRAARRRLGGR